MNGKRRQEGGRKQKGRVVGREKGEMDSSECGRGDERPKGLCKNILSSVEEVEEEEKEGEEEEKRIRWLLSWKTPVTAAGAVFSPLLPLPEFRLSTLD